MEPSRTAEQLSLSPPSGPFYINATIKAFREAGIDGFTVAKDARGKVLGIRGQYPRIRWGPDEWVSKAEKAIGSLAGNAVRS